jgi:16S rRNA (cytosine1402-N4)-methyltransferase
VANAFAHRPVLLDESVDHLNCKPGSLIVDGTLGGGGHAEAILRRTGPDGVVLGLDLDGDALEAAAHRLGDYGDRLRCVHASFRDLDAVLRDLGIDRVDGVLLDLGVSSFQLDTPERGFRFSGNQRDTQATALDMRMDRSRGRTAAELLRSASANELQTLFQEYGELPGSKRLARAIVDTRGQRPLETSADLLQLIREVGVGGGRRHHPATRVFQALRIAVNDELGALRAGLEVAVGALRRGGRLVIIAYHSVEDRVVKQHFRAAARGCSCPPRTPVCICGGVVTLRVLTRKPIKPSAAECAANPRARSACLRAAERVADQEAA